MQLSYCICMTWAYLELWYCDLLRFKLRKHRGAVVGWKTKGRLGRHIQYLGVGKKNIFDFFQKIPSFGRHTEECYQVAERIYSKIKVLLF